MVRLEVVVDEGVEEEEEFMDVDVDVVVDEGESVERLRLICIVY